MDPTASKPAIALSSIPGALDGVTIDASPVDMVELPEAVGMPDAVAFDSPRPLTGSDNASSNWYTIAKYGGIIILLGLLGLNIFRALENATDTTVSFLQPVFSALGYGAGETIKGTTSILGEGAKGAIDLATGVVHETTTLAQKGTGAEGSLRRAGKLNRKLDRAAAKDPIGRVRPPPEGDSSGSVTQSTRGSKRKGGFCYIGTDSGIRSCMRVSDGSECMSGDIFPSRAICMNPRLRQ